MVAGSIWGVDDMVVVNVKGLGLVLVLAWVSGPAGRSSVFPFRSSWQDYQKINVLIHLSLRTLQHLSDALTVSVIPRGRTYTSINPTKSGGQTYHSHLTKMKPTDTVLPLMMTQILTCASRGSLVKT